MLKHMDLIQHLLIWQTFKSDIFITSSDSMEPWKDKIVKSLKLNKSFDMSEHVKLRTIQEENDEHHEDKKNININMTRAWRIDPHYWVSLNNYILMTEAITKLLLKR